MGVCELGGRVKVRMKSKGERNKGGGGGGGGGSKLFTMWYEECLRNWYILNGEWKFEEEGGRKSCKRDFETFGSFLRVLGRK